MITVREIVYAVYGAWRLARADTRGMDYFDDSIDGFWRSFFAAVVVAPGYVLLVLLRLAETHPEAAPLRIFLVEVIAYVTSWVAFPLMMVYVARFLDREQQYFGYIVAYNWASILQVTVFLPVTAVATLSAGKPAELLLLATTIAILLYEWFIARIALGVSGLAATGVVFADTVLAIVITGTADGMIARG